MESLKFRIADVLIKGFLVVLLCFGAEVGVGLANSVSVFGMDVVAGNEVSVKLVSDVRGGDAVVSLLKPTGVKVDFLGKTNEVGELKMQIDGYHTQSSGDYKLSAKVVGEGKNLVSKSSSFRVYAGEVDVNRSNAVLEKTIVKPSADSLVLEVNLVDKFGNAVSGSKVKVVSSRESDKVIGLDSKTNELGQMKFNFSSNEEGVSYLSIIDSNSDLVLKQRPMVIVSKNVVDGMGGDLVGLFPKALAQETGPLSKFLVDMPVKVEPNVPVSVKVSAVDQNGLVVKDYTGTIHFSIEGESAQNVTLPQDYQFKAEDLGVHTFELGIKFPVTGNFKVLVNDLNDKNKAGEISIVVGSGESLGGEVDFSGSVKIVAPISGKYGTKTIIISGDAPAGANVKILQNESEIGLVKATNQGKFLFQASDLQDGEVSLKAVIVGGQNEVLATSNEVKVLIDTLPPVIDELKILPGLNVVSGDVLKIQLFSEKSLSLASVVVDGVIVDLKESVLIEGLYEGEILAPGSEGEFGVDVVLVDELQNEANFKEKVKITVSKKVVAENKAPSQVLDLLAYSSDRRVSLNWAKSLDSDGSVVSYKIYYGLSPASLNNFVETKKSVDNWFLDGLLNDVDYYFAVSAVDDLGLEGPRSVIVGAKPFVLIENEDMGGSYESLGYPEEMQDTGPGILFLAIPSLVVGRILKRRK